uniref:RNase H type-1 domain-containing protein n=1 Tax=Glycine max TaxID=3847 RepID=A0A0R0EKU3_SOYBN
MGYGRTSHLIQHNPNWWTLYVDGASNVKGSRAGIILEGPNNITLEQALKLNFRALNNQAEYEALIAGLKLAREVEAKKLRCYTDSQLVQEHVANKYQTKEIMLFKYYHIAKTFIENFKYQWSGRGS